MLRHTYTEQEEDSRSGLLVNFLEKYLTVLLHMSIFVIANFKKIKSDRTSQKAH